jgi:hypothetical protein
MVRGLLLGQLWRSGKIWIGAVAWQRLIFRVVSGDIGNRIFTGNPRFVCCVANADSAKSAAVFADRS